MDLSKWTCSRSFWASRVTGLSYIKYSNRWAVDEGFAQLNKSDKYLFTDRTKKELYNLNQNQKVTGFSASSGQRQWFSKAAYPYGSASKYHGWLASFCKSIWWLTWTLVTFSLRWWQIPEVVQNLHLWCRHFCVVGIEGSWAYPIIEKISLLHIVCPFLEFYTVDSNKNERLESMHWAVVFIIINTYKFIGQIHK